ncbi:hypothetical protein D9M72_495690 [compost metagenome]
MTATIRSPGSTKESTVEEIADMPLAKPIASSPPSSFASISSNMRTVGLRPRV